MFESVVHATRRAVKHGKAFLFPGTLEDVLASDKISSENEKSQNREMGEGPETSVPNGKFSIDERVRNNTNPPSPASLSAKTHSSTSFSSISQKENRTAEFCVPPIRASLRAGATSDRTQSLQSEDFQEVLAIARREGFDVWDPPGDGNCIIWSLTFVDAARKTEGRRLPSSPA